MNLRNTVSATAFVVGLCVLAGYAQAQEASIPERQSVLQRARPDYQALGVRAGSFLIYPDLGLAESYDTNVYSTTTNRVRDFVTDVKPDLRVRSDWNVHALNFAASADIKRYQQRSTEDTDDYRLGTDGRLDILRGIYLRGGVSYSQEHEPRASPDAVTNAQNPIEYTVANANMSFVHDTGRLALQVNGNVDDYSYRNGITATGGIISQTGRDRIEYSAATRFSYEIVPGYHAFVRTSFNRRNYKQAVDASGFDRTSHGYEADVGTAISLGAAINGELFGGYFDQIYNDARLKPASGPTLGGKFLWNVTELTSIRSSIVRSVQETTVTNASTYVQTDFGLSVEHELLRNVLLTAGTDYITQDFQGIGRTDTNYSASVGAQYLANRYLHAGLGVNYSHRISNAPGLEFTTYVFSANVRLQF